MVFLAVEKQTEEAFRILTEHLFGCRKETTILGEKSIEFFAGRSAQEGDSKREFERTEYGSLNLCDLEDAGRMLVNISGVEVVVPHKSFNPAKLGFMAVVELFCDDPLKTESEDISALACMIVEAITDAVKKIESFLELSTGVYAQDATALEFVKIASIKERVGDPDQVVKIPHASRTFLQVGLLEKHSRREFVVTSLDVSFSLLKKTEAVFDYAFLPERLAKLLGKIVVARNFSVIE